jgi:hypothetical protein
VFLRQANLHKTVLLFWQTLHGFTQSTNSFTLYTKRLHFAIFSKEIGKTENN